jgi:hypothetical protein
MEGNSGNVMRVSGGHPPLPYTLDALTPEWVAWALQIRHPFIQVLAVDISRLLDVLSS